MSHSTALEDRVLLEVLLDGKPGEIRRGEEGGERGSLVRQQREETPGKMSMYTWCWCARETQLNCAL